MKIFKHINRIIEEIKELKQQKKTIGFVPTMGALHKGHFSLIDYSKKENDITVISIFLNPAQFNNKNDLKNYPRTLNADIKNLRLRLCPDDILFSPSEKEMFISQGEPDNRVSDLGHLDKIMEGKFRNGHFQGVAMILNKLFKIITPDKAYFGQKDYQQLVIVKHLINKLNIPVQIVACPIIRERDGLAMSSRNTLLSKDDRLNAASIFQTLSNARCRAKNLSVEETKQWVIRQINSNPMLRVEYFEIVDNKELKTIKSWSEDKIKVGCIAVKVGNIRLIDNIIFNL